MQTETKICTKCGIPKQLNEYYQNQKKSECIECLLNYQRNYKITKQLLENKKTKKINYHKIHLEKIKILENEAYNLAIKNRFTVGKLDISKMIIETNKLLNLK